MSNGGEANANANSVFPGTAEALRRTVGEALPKLRAVSELDASKPLAPGKWSAKQVIGHLIDSAANNHQRFVRAQQGADLAFPSYAQDDWVASQHYGERGWDDLLSLWEAYNRHIAHVIRWIPEERQQARCTIGPHDPVTLAFLAADYLAHLRHHLSQLVA